MLYLKPDTFEMVEISAMKTLESVENFTTPSGNVCDLGHGYSYTSAGKKIFPKNNTSVHTV